MDHEAAARAGGPEVGVLAQISNEMVRLYKELFGRGPGSSRTDWAGPNVLVCTLRDTMTPAERKLGEMGEFQRLRDTRLFFQHASETEFRGVIERLAGREVEAFISGMDVHEDVSCEIFYLAPLPDGEVH
jgi:uncharacterized protein YbcI